ncbi:MAG TPA: NUDIX domain-containing protein [Polyangiaceae bacterium]|nr:NUDIX domain-containing protein [Polyangiaceae bacterium]
MDRIGAARAELVPVVAVGGVVLAPGPHVLLIKRGTAPLLGQWTLPGGRLRGGETIAAALEREVLEETGIRVTAGRLIEVIEIVTEGYHYVVHDHLCRPIDASEVPKAGDDAAEARYVGPSELPSFNVTEAVARVVRRGLAMGQVRSEDT